MWWLTRPRRDRSVGRFREKGIRLPTFAELRNPSIIDPAILADLAGVDHRLPDARNLFRVHWHNTDENAVAELVEVPFHIELPSALTGVDARIVLIVGDRFPMITAHKVLAAYACLAPRVVTGTFDPDGPSGHLAVNRQLRARWCGHQSHHGQPRRRGVAGRDEPRAFRLAEPMDDRPGKRHHPHTGNREQREGDLRHVRGARPVPRKRGHQPVL